MDEIRLYNPKRHITPTKHTKAVNKPKWTLYRHTATADIDSRTAKAESHNGRTAEKPEAITTARKERQTRKPTKKSRKPPHKAKLNGIKTQFQAGKV